MDLEFIDIKHDTEEVAYEDRLFKASYHISPFRPEMFGSLIYATIFYICHKYDIEDEDKDLENKTPSKMARLAWQFGYRLWKAIRQFQ